MKHVNKKLFSQEEMDQLSANKYVKTVYPSTVRFTEEFKSKGVRPRQRKLIINQGVDFYYIWDYNPYNSKNLRGQCVNHADQRQDIR